MRVARPVVGSTLLLALATLSACAPGSSLDAPSPTTSPAPFVKVDCEEVGAIPEQGTRSTVCYVGELSLPLSSHFPPVVEAFVPSTGWRPEADAYCRDRLPEKSSTCRQLFVSRDATQAAKIIAIVPRADYVAGTATQRVRVVVGIADCEDTINVVGCEDQSADT
jgi:hypothetical protein